MQIQRATYLLQELGLIQSRLEEVLVRATYDGEPIEHLSIILAQAVKKVEAARQILRSTRHKGQKGL